MEAVARRIGFVASPPKRWIAVLPKGRIWASLRPLTRVRMNGTATPMSMKSVSPAVTASVPTTTLTSMASSSAMRSFSYSGSPSVPEGVPSSWLKFSCRPSRGTPFSDLNSMPVTLAPMKKRPRPSVCVRSPKIGPAEVDVRTGIPPENENVAPLDVALRGTLSVEFPIASVRKEMTASFPWANDGMK